VLRAPPHSRLLARARLHLVHELLLPGPGTAVFGG
jgi:hypothetical protein